MIKGAPQCIYAIGLVALGGSANHFKRINLVDGKASQNMLDLEAACLERTAAASWASQLCSMQAPCSKKSFEDFQRVFTRYGFELGFHDLQVRQGLRH
jgi:hypothetical protein